MDKLFNRVAKSFFLLRPMRNLLTKKKIMTSQIPVREIFG